MRGRLVIGALIWLCALIAVAATVSVWWLLAAAGAFLGWLHFQRHHGAPPTVRMSIATIVSLVSYALLLSIALLTVRAARGLLELPVVPVEPAALAPGMERTSLGYYDKSELHRALLELAALTVLFAIVFVRLAGNWMRSRGEPFVLHPLSAAFAFVLYFASVRLPPYPVDPDYWYPLVAAATRIHFAEWPSLIVDPTQGLLRPYLLGLWLWAFGSSALSLSAAATICNIAAGLASFALVHKLTGSRAVALLGASYLLLEATTTHASRLTFPAPAHAALAMLLLYLSLRSRGERLWPAFFFGLILAWDVWFGVFAAIGFVLAHGGRILPSPSHVRPAWVRTGLAMCAGIGVSIVAPLALHGAFTLSSQHGAAAPAIERILARPPQEPGPESLLPFLLLLVPVFVRVALASRTREKLRQWSAPSRFAGATLLCAMPYASLAAGPSHAYSIQWILLPAAALGLYGAVRAIVRKRRFRAAFSLWTSAMVLVICFDLFFPVDRLNLVLARYATGYESERASWYRKCAEGLACDPSAKPTLANYVRQASRPLALDRETTRGL